MDLCCSGYRKNNKDINKDIQNEQKFNIFNKFKNFFLNHNKESKHINVSNNTENVNISKLIFDRNNHNPKKELNKNYIIYLRLKYPIVTLYEIPDSYNIVCNVCFKTTKEEIFRTLPCGHYCHTSCLDYLGKIYSNNMKYYGKYLIYNCKLCNKNIKL